MRGTTPEQEQRKLRPVERLRGPWKYADDLSTGGAEVVFLSLPGTVALVNSGFGSASIVFSLFASIAVLSIGVAAGGCGWVTFEPPWPKWRLSTFLLRIAYYSLAMVVLGVSGAVAGMLAGPWVALGVIVALGAGFVALLPRSFVAVSETVRRVRAWHRWLFPPQHRY